MSAASPTATAPVVPSPTWNGADYVQLPPLTGLERARGGLRVAAMLAATAVALLLFLAGRAIRRHLWGSFSGHYAVARLWSALLLRLFGVRREVRGAPLTGPGVLVANHATWADILALRAVLRINFVAKAEVRNWPGVGWVAHVCETVFIERRRMASRDQAVQMRERLERDETLCIFAEGTSSDGLRVLPFKSALLSAVVDMGQRHKVAVQPVTVNWIAPDHLPEAFYGWWGTMGFEAHIWQVACRSAGGVVEVVFHDPVLAGTATDRKALTRHCEAAVRSAKRGASRVDSGEADG